MNYPKLKAILIEDEGLRLFPYRDTVGKLTIGVGRNLDDVGISKFEALMLLDNDIGKVIAALAKMKWFTELNEVRQAVIISMIFNMGMGGFNEFGRMRAALIAKSYTVAALEMLESKWASQVGDRAKRLASMMKHGMWE